MHSARAIFIAVHRVHIRAPSIHGRLLSTRVIPSAEHLHSRFSLSDAIRYSRTSQVACFSSTAYSRVPGSGSAVHGNKSDLDGPLPSSTSFPDPSRPDLFYHLLEPPTPLPTSSHLPAFAISFLPDAPPKKDSRTTIGWLPAQSSAAAQSESVDGALPGNEEGEGAGLNDFAENHRFREILHRAIQSGLQDGVDETQIAHAIQLQHGWMHIHDERNPPPLGRIGDPDDIIATVLVDNGQILPETYQPMPAYRFCTADGVVQLTSGLNERLRDMLRKEAEAEQLELKMKTA